MVQAMAVRQRTTAQTGLQSSKGTPPNVWLSYS